MPSIDSMLDMYLAGARDTAKELVRRLRQTSLPPGWVQQQEEEIIAELVKLRFDAGHPLVLVVEPSGFRWSYRSGFRGRLQRVVLSTHDEVSYKIIDQKYGVLIAGNRPDREPYVYQEF